MSNTAEISAFVVHVNWLTILVPLLLWLITILSLNLAYMAWKHHTIPGAYAMLGLNLALSVWSCAYGVELEFGGLATKILCTKIVYIGVVAAPPAWFIFAARYTKRDSWLSRKALALLVTIPLLTLLLVWTNEEHHLIWQSMVLARVGSYETLATSYGGWFIVHTLYSYSMLIAGSFLLVQALLPARRFLRWQSFVLLFGALAPMLGNVLHVLRLAPIYPLDPTPFAFGLSTLAFMLSMVRLQLFNVIPVAHHAVVAGMQEAVIIVDQLHRIADLNTAAERMLALPARAVLGKPVETALQSMPHIVAACAEPVQHQFDMPYPQDEQGPCLYDVTVTPLSDRHQRVTSTLIMLRDVTRNRRIEVQQRFLADASVVLASSLDLEPTLAAITRLAVPTLADICQIHIQTADGTIRRVGLSCADPEKEQAIAQLQREDVLETPYAYTRVIRTGQLEFEPEIGGAWQTSVAKSDKYLDTLRNLGIRSFLCVPLVARERILGAISLATAESGRRYDQSDLALAEDLARRAALAVDNAQLFADLRASEARAQRANQAAGEASQAKSSFLATMSHEIRTPMNGVLGAVDLLRLTKLDVRQQELVHILNTSGQALLTLIDDVLDFSKIESGKLELNLTPVDVLATIEEVVDLVAISSQVKGLDLSHQIAANVPGVILTDGVRLRQILLNLLSNAVKFTSEGSVAIFVTATLTPTESSNDHFTMSIAIKDTGIGIAPQHLDRLFDSFTQADAMTTRRYGGTGLGLAISKRLAELLGGTIAVESVPNHGSTFLVTLATVAVPDAPSVVPRGLTPALKGIRLLVVHKHQLSVEALVAQGRAWGMQVDVVSEIEQALVLLHRHHYDIVLVDARLDQQAPKTFADLLNTVHDNTIGLVEIVDLVQQPLPTSQHPNHTVVLRRPVKLSQLFEAFLHLTRPPQALAESSAASAKAEHIRNQQTRVLLVEDDAVNRLLTTYMLRAAGYEPDVVEHGERALEVLQTTPYDIVLIDLQLPDIDGLEVTRHLVQQTANQRPYIIMITATVTPEERANALARGVDEYLSKPLSGNELVRAIARGEVARGRSTNLTNTSPPHPTPAPPVLADDTQTVIQQGRQGITPQAPPLDPETLAQLRTALGEQATQQFAILVHSYLTDSPHLLATLREALAHSSQSRIQYALHRLQSSSAIVGAKTLAQYCADGEAAVAEGHPEIISQLLPQIEAEYPRVQAALEELVAPG